MQLAVERHLGGDLAAVRLEPAVHVVQLDAGDERGRAPLKSARRDHARAASPGARSFQPLTRSAPASSTASRRGISCGSSCRSPSSGDDAGAARGAKADRERRRLAEIACAGGRARIARIAGGEVARSPRTSRPSSRRRRRPAPTTMPSGSPVDLARHSSTSAPSVGALVVDGHHERELGRTVARRPWIVALSRAWTGSSRCTRPLGPRARRSLLLRHAQHLGHRRRPLAHLEPAVVAQRAHAARRRDVLDRVRRGVLEDRSRIASFISRSS